MGITTSGFDSMLRELRRTTTDKVIMDRFVKDHGKTVINVVRGTAKAGIGPANEKYPALSKRYAARKAKKVGKFADIWLTLSGEMLKEQHFSWEVNPNGKTFLVWTAPDDNVGTYAEVHQEGLPLGRGGPRKKRTWLHFGNTANQTALFKALELALDKLVIEFNLNRRVK